MNAINFAEFNFLTLLLVFAAGLATSLTPCIYPLVPVVVGYLGNQAGSTQRRIFVSISYVLGLSSVYSLLGLVAVATGNVFGEMTTSPTLYIAFGILLLVLGGSMMDFFAIPLPRLIRPQSGAAPGAHSLLQSFMVGATSGLVASPCTAPVLAGLLVYIGSQKIYLKGMVLMMVFALGMNTLLLALGFSAGFLRNMPRSGRWMITIKKAMGLLLIGSALYYVFRAGQIS